VRAESGDQSSSSIMDEPGGESRSTGVSVAASWTGRTKLLNFFVFVMIVLAWMCCIVIFSTNLHTGTYMGLKSVFYWQKAKIGTVTFDYADYQSAFASTCMDGGRGLIAITAFCFIAVNFAFILFVLRLIGKISCMPRIGTDINKYMWAEIMVSLLMMLFFFFATLIWGNSCFRKCKESAGFDDLMPTGFLYIIVTFIMMIPNTIALYLVKRNATSHSTLPQPLLDP